MASRSKGWVRALGASMVVDGLLLTAFARNYLRLWRVGPPGNLHRRVLDWLIDRPPWVLRAVGAAEAGLGIVLVGKAPLVANFYSG